MHVQANRTAVVRELARLGADLEARNDSGQVPAQLTKDRLVCVRRRGEIINVEHIDSTMHSCILRSIMYQDSSIVTPTPPHAHPPVRLHLPY